MTIINWLILVIIFTDGENFCKRGEWKSYNSQDGLASPAFVAEDRLPPETVYWAATRRHR